MILLTDYLFFFEKVCSLDFVRYVHGGCDIVKVFMEQFLTAGIVYTGARHSLDCTSKKSRKMQQVINAFQ